ncbi:MAG: protein kinase domain-containing protein, partial [Myxococcota bacterium]
CQACGARYRGRPQSCPLDGSPLVDAPDPIIGRTIGGRYVIQEKIGSGGMGTVYRAHHEVLGRDVAVKFLSSASSADEGSRKRFLREARAANRINHEHIIDITDYGETDDNLVYLVMEYLDGTPLNRLIQRGPIPAERALRIALQMSWALGRAHELDVIHRDIKPDNVHLLESHGGDFVKIFDFGLAHVKGELRLTASGTVFGTPEYIAPEQARGLRAAPGSDLYSFGCVLFEMLTGRLPFEGGTSALVLKHMREPPPIPSSVGPPVPPEVDSLVLRLLEKDPQARPASAYQVAQAIGEILSQRTGPGSPPAPTRNDSGEQVSGARRPEPDRTTSSEEDWERHVQRLRRLLPRAHPEGLPAWLARAIEGLDARVAEMLRLKRARDERLEDVSRREGELREIRLRIGRALDELARDEGQVALRIAESEAPLLEARRTLKELEEAIRERWKELPGPPADESPLPDDAARTLVALGALARRWEETGATVRRLEQALEPWIRQRDDLRFQIAQLKGRMASIGADKGVDLESAKNEADELDRRVQGELENVLRDAEPVMKHLMGFPELRRAFLSGEAAEGRPRSGRG